MSIRIILFYLFLTGSLFAQVRPIAFEQLNILLETSALSNQILEDKLTLKNLENEARLQWQNPQIGFGLEHVEKAGSRQREETFYVSKTFKTNWLLERSIINQEKNVQQLKTKYLQSFLLAQVRGEWVEAGLLGALQRSHQVLGEILSGLITTIEVRQQEGALSKVEAGLLASGQFSMQSAILTVQKKHRKVLADLQYRLSIPHGEKISIVGEIPFIEVPYGHMPNLMEMNQLPLMQAIKEEEGVYNRQVTLARLNILPAFTLQGGYKKVERGWEGYTFGLALPLPILNWNGSEIEAKKIALKIKTAQRKQYTQQLQNKIINLKKRVEETARLLKNSPLNLNDHTMIEGLLAAYEEGILSLGDFLNAIQIYRDGQKGYVEQLTGYYQALFELEALTGKQFVKI